jgi:hypothetical protein
MISGYQFGTMIEILYEIPGYDKKNNHSPCTAGFFYWLF